MPEAVRTTRVRVVKEKGRIRRAEIEGAGEPIYFGKQAGSIDQMIAAISACMVETLAVSLAAEKIGVSEDIFRADVEGDLETVNGVPRLTTIRVRYRLKLRPDQKKRRGRHSRRTRVAAPPLKASWDASI